MVGEAHAQDGTDDGLQAAAAGGARRASRCRRARKDAGVLQDELRDLDADKGLASTCMVRQTVSVYNAWLVLPLVSRRQPV